ncbi:MAG: hypothetical protein L3J24_14705 [Xanthomonadales bacterium]|nr:hypothetical protein [Xanthomonadales bacterium]
MLTSGMCFKFALTHRLALVIFLLTALLGCTNKSKINSEGLCSINYSEAIDIAHCLHQKKEYKLAAELYSKAIEKSTIEKEQNEYGIYLLLSEIGSLYFRLREYHHVPFYLEQALAIEDYDMNSWELLSVSYFRQGMCAKGKQAMLNYEKITNKFDANFLLEHPDVKDLEDPVLDNLRKEEDNCSKGILSKDEGFWQLDEPEAKM